MHENYEENLLKGRFLSASTGWWSQNLPLLLTQQIIFYLVKFENNLCFFCNTLIKKYFLLLPWIVCFAVYTVMINVLAFHCQHYPELSRAWANNFVKDMNTIQEKNMTFFTVVVLRNRKSYIIFAWNGIGKVTLP